MSNPFSVRDPRTSIQKLKDVKLTNIAGGEILAYNDTSQLWENSDSIITISNSNIISSSLGAGSSLTTGNFNVLLGVNAGTSITTGIRNVMIGSNSGQNVNVQDTVCLGYQAGFNASDSAICLGSQSGFQNCGANAICIGPSSGFSRCGQYSVNIGTLASGNLTNGTAHDRSININATGSNSDSVANDSCVIKPIRNQSSNSVIQYNSTTGEVSHSNTLNGTFETTGKMLVETDVLIGGNHKNYGNGHAFFADKDRYNNNNDSHALITTSSGLTALNSSNNNDVVITHQNAYNHRFKSNGDVYHKKKVGINTLNPLTPLHITQFNVEDLIETDPDLDNDDRSAIRIQYGGNFWDIAYAANDQNLHFLFNRDNRGFLNDGFDAGQIDFTGQHRSSSNIQFTDNHVGLIVSSVGTYNNLSGDNSPSIDEAIPKVELSSVQNDKKVFGVISNNEGKTREYRQGIFVSVAPKNADDNRLIINSLGEGGIWVCNINGNLENGDYITSSSVGGYGMKQDDDLLHNYTVAKITCDCDFTTSLRYLDTSGNMISKEEYDLNGGYIAAFVGCTYHCG